MSVQGNVLQSEWNDPASIFARQLATRESDGFVILRGCFGRPVVEAVKCLVDQLWEAQTQIESKLSVDVFLDSAEQKRFLFRHAPLEARGKIAVAWLALETIDTESRPLLVYPGSHKIAPFLSRKGGTRIEADEMP